MDAAAVTGGGRPARGAVVAADGDQPVLARRVLLLQDFRGDGEVAVWVEQLAGMRVAVRVVAEVDLAEAGVDAVDRRAGERPADAGAGLGPRGIAFGAAG